MTRKFTEAIQLATRSVMEEDSSVHVLGLGANYPNGLDGTMGDIAETFHDRVHDTPCSENAVTGMAVGMAISGLRPIVHHGRIEFALHAMDQIITQAAKWNYMFGGNYPCPLTLRIAMGRQWGNGPQHTLSYKGLFSVPGLQVVCPSTPQAAYSLLQAAVENPNPVVFLESRWLYKTQGTIINTSMLINKAMIMRSGTDLTIVAAGEFVLEALRAAKVLGEHGISVEVIDLVSVYPIDMETLRESVGKTGKLMVIDSTSQFAMEIAARANVQGASVVTLSCVESPCPTAPSMSDSYYPTDQDIIGAVSQWFGKFDIPVLEKTFAELNLAPTDNFDELYGIDTTSD
jgi:pyruvate dehydrogenase E1 component beta subunit